MGSEKSMIGVVVVFWFKKKKVALLANSLLKAIRRTLWLCLYDIRHLLLSCSIGLPISLWDLFSRIDSWQNTSGLLR